MPFCPLGRGFLTGTVRRAEDYPPADFRHHDPRFRGDNFAANVRAAEAVRTLAAEKGATPGQVALAWLLHRGADIVPIPGTKRRTYLEENAAAAELQLSSDDLRRLEAILSPDQVAGPRYDERMMSFVDR